MEAASCGRCVHVALPQRSQHRHVDQTVQTVEEYVLDEQDFGHFRLVSSAMPRDNRQQQQQQHQQRRHVRRSAELRTVSIIETLSELVAGQGEGGKLDDCDGQCRRRLLLSEEDVGGALPPEVVSRNGRSADSGSGAATVRKTGVRCCNGKVKDSQTSKAREASNGTTVTAVVEGSACCGDRTLGKVQNCGCRGHGRKADDRGHCRRADDRGQCRSAEDRRHCRRAEGGGHCRRAESDEVGKTEDCLRLHREVVVEGARVQNCSSSAPGKRFQKGQSVAMDSERPKATTNSGGPASRPSEVSAAQKVGEDPVSGSRKRCAHVVHDPSHFMLSTLRGKGRTPDWIAGIFSIARRGNLQRLSQALVGMDATLIRNLSDHRGNNLFHVCCCYGHLDSLQWLMQRGKQCEDAILDENKYELTPLVCAVKYGKLPCVEWLIQNTIARGQLVPSSGCRPLLHWAAKYGQEVILRWLAEYMEHNSMDINVKDGHGNTALHLAAKHGHAVSIKALVIHRCDASLKNDIGYKASDYASLYGQTACSEYLLSLEACLLLSSDVATLDADIYTSRAEMSETKIQFKDVLSCAKKLVKEREELSQHLDRLQDGLVHLNDVIIAAIQGLYEENSRLREKADGRRQCENSQSIDETIALCHAMQTRWKDGQQRWLSPSALGEIQQKILLAEERWKRARVRATWEHKESKEHIDVFRERLAQVQCRATGIRLSDIRSISSSESSLASMEDTMSEYEERYELCGNAKPFSPFFAEGNDKLSSLQQQHSHTSPQLLHQEDSSIQSRNVRLGQPSERAGANKIEPCSNRRTNKLGFPAECSQFKAVSQKPNLKQNHQRTSKVASTQFRGKDADQLVKNGHNANVGLVSQGTCKVLEVIVSSANEGDDGSRMKCGNGVSGHETEAIDHHESEQPWTVDAYSETGLLEQVSSLKMYTKSCNAELQKQAKRTKISSATVAATRGHCKSEILECQGGNGGDDEDNRRNAGGRSARDQSSSLAGGNVAEKICQGNCGNGESQGKGGHSNNNNNGRLEEQQQRDLQVTSNELSELFEEFRMVTPPVPRAKSPTLENSGKLVSSEPDLIIGTKGIRGNLGLLNSLPADIPEVLTADGAEIESTDLDDGGNDLAANNDETTSELVAGELRLIEMDAEETCMGLVACHNGNPVKRRGFLQKLNLRWPSKRKVSNNSNKKVNEISPENFRETYLHVRNGPGEDGEQPNDATPAGQEMAASGRTLSAGGNGPVVEAVDSAPRSSVDSSSLRDDAVLGVNIDNGGFHGAVREIDASSSSSRCSLTTTVVHLESNKDEKSWSECASSASTGCKDSAVPPLPARPPSFSKMPTEDVESTARFGMNPYPKKFHGPVEGVIPAAPVGPRNIPVPPLPEDPPIDLDGHNDSESACESQNGYSYVTLPMPEHCQSRQGRSECSRDEEDDDDEDDDDGDEEQKDSSRPEADQDIPLDKLADDQCNLIHAQANMPPQRPLSCGAKSEQGGFPPRPESSVSQSCYSAVFRLPGYPLRKASSSASTDLLTPDSLTPSRMSPAPSEVSKTESALSPPSDISKTESVRHMRLLTRIEERKKIVSVPALATNHSADVKVAAIVDINAMDNAKKKLAVEDEKLGGGEARPLKLAIGDQRGSARKVSSDAAKISVPDISDVAIEKNQSKEKPWYELSDDEEILMPETLRRNVGIVKSSSEEDEAYSCT